MHVLNVDTSYHLASNCRHIEVVTSPKFLVSPETISLVKSSSLRLDYVAFRDNKVLPYPNDISESNELQAHLSLRFQQFGGISFAYLLQGQNTPIISRGRDTIA